ncbi:MAG: hypothetical protein IJY82_04635 [Oscillospiraceae bacterium]|nr:hypothetical protein [Oscillospiraceae bacterium]
MKLKRINNFFARLFSNDGFLRVFSVLVAVVAWFVVSLTISDAIPRTVRSVPINFDIEGTATGQLGLSIIDHSVDTVDITVEGRRSEIGSLKAEDFTVTGIIGRITTAGTYEIELEVTTSAEGNFIVKEISPAVVEMTFDRLDKKTLDVTVDTSALSVAEGYLMDTAYPASNTFLITGPASELEKVDRCVLKIGKQDSALKETGVFSAKPILVDEAGKEVKTRYVALSAESVEVTVPVLLRKTLPITVTYKNIPQGFPVESLQWQLLSEDQVITEIEVAGPEETIREYTELSVATIDLRELVSGYEKTIEVTLPTGFVNISELTSVTYQLTQKDLTQKYVTVPKAQMKLANPPADVTVKISSTSRRIQVVGDKEIISRILAADVLITVDLSEISDKTGNYVIPVSVTVPDMGLVWAYGEYTITVSVQGK